MVRCDLKSFELKSCTASEVWLCGFFSAVNLFILTSLPGPFAQALSYLVFKKPAKMSQLVSFY